MRIEKYESGQKAIELSDDDTCFVYYPNGKVCVSVVRSSLMSKIYYAFSSKGNKTLFVHDEDRKTGQAEAKGLGSLTYNQRGFMIINSEGMMTNNVEWDTAPNLRHDWEINLWLKVAIRGRNDISLSFHCENIDISFSLGVDLPKQPRKHLPEAKHIIPTESRLSLVQRQNQFNELMAHKKNLLTPKSDNLMITRDVVRLLESHLDPIPLKLSSTSSTGSIWRDEAFTRTISELPTVPLCGSEVGDVRGLGTYVYDSGRKFEPPAYLLSESGQFKNELDIIKAIKAIHPPLNRGRMISTTSGRYSGMLVVDRKNISPVNPTGMKTLRFAPLLEMSWQEFKTRVGPLRDSKLHVLLMARQSEHEGYYFKRIAEAANEMIAEDNEKRHQIIVYYCEIADNPESLVDLNLKSHPVFIMAFNGSVVYGGKCGGQMLPKKAVAPIVIVIEPDIKFQVGLEKSLRRSGFQTILCLTVAEAIVVIDSMMGQSSALRSSYLRAVLVANEANAPSITLLSGKLSQSAFKDAELIALVNVFDRNLIDRPSIRWDETFCSSDVSNWLQPPLSRHVKMVTPKPLKPKTIQYMRECWSQRSEYFGLTSSSLIRMMSQTLVRTRTAGCPSVDLSEYRLGISLNSSDDF